MKVLYISRFSIYEGVPHAGGNTVYYYSSNLAKNSSNDIRILSFATSEELDKIKPEDHNIKQYCIPWNKNAFGMIKSISSKLNPFTKYCNMIALYHIDELIEKLIAIRNEFIPDIVIVEWTQLVLAIDKIKEVFSDSVYVASEHDVTFQAFQRKYKYEKNIIKKVYKYFQFINIRNREIYSLNKYDLVLVHNKKDVQLLKETHWLTSNILPIVAYFHQSVKKYERKNKNIIYYGALSRTENIESVKWFINNVMPKLKDLDITFLVIGGGLTDELKKYESSKIHFTGYVDTIDDYFSVAMCFVAPIIMGAGIKVKVLEALYSGITVLTNDVGIEGIPAKNNIDYYHCESASEYEKTIKEIYYGKKPLINAQKFINENFDLIDSFQNYEDVLVGLSNKNNELIKNYVEGKL